MTSQEKFARNLKRARKAAELSQERLANRAGLSTPYISQLESGVRSAPSYPTLLALAKALGCGMKDLVG